MCVHDLRTELKQITIYFVKFFLFTDHFLQYLLSSFAKINKNKKIGLLISVNACLSHNFQDFHKLKLNPFQTSKSFMKFFFDLQILYFISKM